MIIRHCEADIELERHTLPKGADVYIPTFLVHKSPDLWPQPYRFDPGRFSNEERMKREAMTHIAIRCRTSRVSRGKVCPGPDENGSCFNSASLYLCPITQDGGTTTYSAQCSGRCPPEWSGSSLSYQRNTTATPTL
ncbi:Cytochrome P450 3A28 [Geodia barretti]|nr:Cytochrome P450 3A28 [Geodia barretti]